MRRTLTPEQIEKILRLRREHGLSLVALSQRFAVSYEKIKKTLGEEHRDGRRHTTG